MKFLTILTSIQVSVFSVLSPLIETKSNLIRNIIQLQNSNITDINEEDFISTMFLKAEFFENWSDTNYFINPTLKTSRPLKYNKNWYLDYIEDSYSTALNIEATSLEFRNLYYNYRRLIDSNFSIIFNKLNVTNKKWLQDILYKPIVPNSKFFLKEIFYVLLQLAGSGMNYDGVSSPYGTYMHFAGWGSKELKNKAILFDNSLSNFNYYTYTKMFQANACLNLQCTKKENVSASAYTIFARELNTRSIRDGNNRLGAVINEFRSVALNFLNSYQSHITRELLRVNNGGSPNYDEFTALEKTKKILFFMEIVDEKEKTERRYSFIMTMNDKNKIQSGNLKLHQFKNQRFQDQKLNFDFDFILNKENNYILDTQIFSYENNQKNIHEQIYGNLDLNNFLGIFFKSAIIPVFKNRSTFIESEYLDNLEYDTVLLDFFGLKDVDFRNLVKITDLSKNKGTWNSFIKNIIILSKDFYKDYLRALFDLDNNTYVQGQHIKHGLLANNGFKIYPRYFYFSDKYEHLEFALYSAYQNRFYRTKYGKNFNFDYSVKSDFNIKDNNGYVFPNQETNNKYKLKHLNFERIKKDFNRKIGFNVFEFQSARINDKYRYYDFNFGIYNWQEITKDGINPDEQWWQAKYESCSWYNITCHLKNGAIWIVNNLPGVKEANKLGSGIGGIFKTIYTFFGQIFEVWKFSPMLYTTVINLFLLIIFLKAITII